MYLKLFLSLMFLRNLKKQTVVICFLYYVKYGDSLFVYKNIENGLLKGILHTKSATAFYCILRPNMKTSLYICNQSIA